jgi:hypothetical protein
MRSMDPASEPSSGPQTPTSATPRRFYEAAHAVLNTNELICEIIGRLPLEDIVVTTGVCRTWRNALKGSVAIQQALFLVPANIQEITTTTKCLSMRIEDIPRRQYAIIGEPHPWTARICGRMYASVTPSWSRDYGSTDEPMLDVEHPAGNWREMFITQPPIKALELSLFVKPKFTQTHPNPYISSHKEHVPYNRAEGIKLGPLYDFIALTLQAWDNHNHSVVTMIVPDGFFSKRSFSVTSRYNRWWEVRNGKVHRRIQPPNNMIDITGDVTDTDDHENQKPFLPIIKLERRWGRR